MHQVGGLIAGGDRLVVRQHLEREEILAPGLQVDTLGKIAESHTFTCPWALRFYPPPPP